MFDLLKANVLFLEGDLSCAAAAYLEGAGDGNAEAAFNYGYCLLHGFGVARNATEAKSFFAYASKLDGGEACYNLAVMYLHGEGVKRDYRRCYEYMCDAAELGCIEAQLYLGIAHTLGSLFEPDIVSISRIPFHTPEYQREGMYIEGYVQDDGEEELRFAAVRFDPVLAHEYFRQAARHSPDYVEELSAKGKYLYARCFLDGVGTDFNRDVANRLMLDAAASGSVEALSYLETDAPYVLASVKDEELLTKINSYKYLNASRGDE